MQHQFTPGAQRALASAAAWTGGEDRDDLDAPALLLGLLAESECRAAIMLAAHGINAAAVQCRWAELRPRKASSEGGSTPVHRFSADVQFALDAACERLREYPQPLELATEHVLLGLAAAEHEVSAWLREQGLDPDAMEAEIHRLYGHCPGPLPLEPPPPKATSQGAATSQAVAASAGLPDQAAGEPPHATSPAGEAVHLIRAVDAAANRAREGLRAVEDYVRFLLDDRHLTGLCKQLRHDLAAALGRIPIEHRLSARETRADVGTGLATSAEQRRETAADVLWANFTRFQEGLRSLEEYGKLLDADMAAELKQLRYGSYILQRAVDITRTSLERLDRARLYVLVDGRSSAAEFRRLAESLIDAGVHVLQLRDKQLDDRRLLQRARLLRELTEQSNTLLIINDRPDLAVLSRADGVHIGQQELTVKDARTIVGPEALVGVSTHSIEQAREAVLDGANYLGVGPVLPSGTKHFNEFPGLELLRKVAAEIRLPAFAIGGVTCENLPEVLAAGFTRIAVSGAIATADDPATAARELCTGLQVPK